MDDLAAWLTQIWDEDEAESRLEKYEAWWVSEDSPFDPDRVRARIAADRQILALHSGSAAYCAWTHDDRDSHQSYGPCDTVKLLALPHADRPGYREEWRP